MPDAQGIHLALELWHLLVGALVVLGAWIGYDRHYLLPLRQWRADMDKWKVGVDKDLDRGKDTFESIKESLADLKAEVKEHERRQMERDRLISERLAAIETLLRERGGIPPE